MPFADGLLGLARADSAHTVAATYTVAAGLTTNNGATLFVEAARLRLNDSTSAKVLHLIAPNGLWAVFVDVSTAGVSVQVFRNGSSATVLVALASLTLGEHNLGVQITMTATGFVVQAKCDAVTGTGTGVVGNSTGCPDITAMEIGGATDAIVSGLQLTTETYTAGMFNDDFIAAA
jgi:hypothetical protein